jgi:hypothetical protein
MHTRASRMDNGVATKRDYVLNDTLLSLNLGLAAAIGMRAYLSQFPAGRNRFFDLFVRVAYGINGLFRSPVDERAAANILFFILIAGFTVAIFVLLRLIAADAITRPIMSVVEGMVVIGALPTCSLYVQRTLDRLSSSSWPIWFLFVGIPLTCVYLYSRNLWSVPDWATVSLLTLSCGFWGWMLSQQVGGDPLRFVFPIASLCSSVAWGLLVRKGRPQSMKAMPTG